jgi:NAD-dependent dihydropyrimidine dehydrogenase PreA subunit
MFLTGLADLFQGWGWTVTWAHALFGLAATLGFAGVLVRFSKNPYFRTAADRVFYIDTAFLSVIGISGSVLFLQLVGLMNPGSGIATMLHVAAAIAWLATSLFMDGLVAHGLATVLYRLHLKGRRDVAAYKAFGSACGRCGKCTEICPQYEASGGQPVEAPALKVRQGLNRLRKSGSRAEAKRLTEEMYACTLCGLCVGVCPYSFRHYDLYTTLLAQVNRSAEGGR